MKVHVIACGTLNTNSKIALEWSDENNLIEQRYGETWQTRQYGSAGINFTGDIPRGRLPSDAITCDDTPIELQIVRNLALPVIGEIP